MIEAEKQAMRALANAIKGHTQLKEQIEQQKIINDGYQKQVEALQVEKTHLQANISALGQTETFPSQFVFLIYCVVR